MKTNKITLGTANLLKVISKVNWKCAAVIITSDKCYENVEKEEGYKENDLLGGIDPYGASKSATEIAIKSYIKSFFSKNDNKIFKSVD